MDRWRKVFGQDSAGGAGHEFRAAPQQIVDFLPESARDPEAPCFADADVRRSSRGQLLFLGYLPQTIVVSQSAERVMDAG